MATITVTSTADSGAGTLRQALIDATSGDTIEFDAVTFPANVETIILINSRLTWSKDIIINGGDTWTNNGDLKTRVILDGQSSYQLVQQNNRITATLLKSITFKNGYTSGYGAGFNAVNASGSTSNTFDKCVFDSCNATTGGTAFYASGTSVNVFNNCVFKNNNGGTLGALLVASTAEATLNNCLFTANSNLAGTVFCYTGGVYKINNCQFLNNTGNPSALSITNNSNVTIKDCNASSNSSFDVSNSNNLDGGTVFDGTNRFGKFRILADSITTIKGSITTDISNFANGSIITFDGVDAVLAITNTLIDGGATFQTSTNSTGYLALYVGATAPTVGTGVTVCTYGADLLTFTADTTGATWTATNLSTPILIEKQNGSTWTALTANATGGSYSTTFAEGDTARGFDGAKFLSFTIPIPEPPEPVASYYEVSENYSLGYIVLGNTPVGYIQ